MDSRGSGVGGEAGHLLGPEGSVRSPSKTNARSAAADRPTGPVAKRIAAIVTTELLNEKEVSKILKTPTGTLRRWRCSGEGPAFIKLGSGPKAAVRYHPPDIERFIDEGRRFSIRAGSAGGEKQWP